MLSLSYERHVCLRGHGDTGRQGLSPFLRVPPGFVGGADLVEVLSKLAAAHVRERALGRDLLEVKFVFHGANKHGFDLVPMVYPTGAVGFVGRLAAVVLLYHRGLKMQYLYCISMREKVM